LNHFKQNNQLFQYFNNDNRCEIFNYISYNNVNQPDKKLQALLGSIELITYPGRIQTWLGLKRNSSTIDNFIWIKITNSFSDNEDMIDPHYYKGFYLSLIGSENSLLIQYNSPLKSFEINSIINFINKITYVKDNDFIIDNIEKIIKRKADFIDKV
jgi:hypothetical protein